MISMWTEGISGDDYRAMNGEQRARCGECGEEIRADVFEDGDICDDCARELSPAEERAVQREHYEDWMGEQACDDDADDGGWWD